MWVCFFLQHRVSPFPYTVYSSCSLVLGSSHVHPLCTLLLVLRKPSCHLPPHFATWDNPTSTLNPQFRCLLSGKLLTHSLLHTGCACPLVLLLCAYLPLSTLLPCVSTKKYWNPDAPWPSQDSLDQLLRPLCGMSRCSWKRYCGKWQFHFFCQDFLGSLNF